MKKFNYEKARNQLADILASMESQELPVDKLAQQVSKAKEIIIQCRERLRQLEEELTDEEE